MATSTMREPRARVPGGGSHPITNTAGLRRLRAATKCASVDEFVSSFARFVDETSVVLSTPVPVEVGAERDFVLQLADGTAVLEGRGKVVEASATDDGASGRHWMRLGLVELTPSSRKVHRALLAVHKLPLPPHPHTVPRAPQRAPSSPPRPTPIPRPPSVPPRTPSDQEETRPGAPPSFSDDEVTRPAAPGHMEALAAAVVPVVERSQAAAPPPPPPPAPRRQRDEERAPGSPYTLSANPLAEMSDDALRSFVDGTLRTNDPRLLPSSNAARGSPVTRGITEAEVGIRRRLGSRVVAVAATLVAASLVATCVVGAFTAMPVAPVPAAVPSRPVDRAAVAPIVRAAAPAAHEASPEPTCRARVITIPDRITVRWGDSELGTTPLVDVPVRCGKADVAMTHPRYERVERTVDATPDAVATVEVTMQRPLGRVSLRSIPPGAVFTVDGTRVERGATEIEVRTFTHLDVAAALPGYQPWERRVYVRGPRDAIVVDLDAAAGR